MRFLTSLLFLTALATPSIIAAPQHLNRMITQQYRTTQPPTTSTPTVYIAPTQEPTEEPTKAPTEPPTEPPTEAPTEPPTEPPTEAPTTYAPTYIVTDAPTTSAPTVYVTTTNPPTAAAPTQLTWCHHEIITTSDSYTSIVSNLTKWTDNLLLSFGLEGTADEFLTTTPITTNQQPFGNCTYIYDNNIDVYLRITLPSDIYPSFKSLYEQYIIDTPLYVVKNNEYTCIGKVDVDDQCENAVITTTPTNSVPTTKAPVVITTTAPTTKAPSTGTTTTRAPTTRAPTTRPGGAATQPPRVNTTTSPTSAPTGSTITITTNVTQPDPNTRCIAGVCVTVNSSASRVAAVPVMASLVALILAVL